MQRLFFGTPDPIPERLEIPSKDKINKDSFNYEKVGHLEIITNRLIRFKHAQAALHHFDSVILRGFSVGFICWAIAGLPLPLPTVILAMGGASAASYNLGTRPHVGLIEAYKKELTDLIEVYEWSMKAQGNLWFHLGSEKIRELILTLGPWVTKETIGNWEDKHFEPSGLIYKRNEPSKEFTNKLIEFRNGEQTKDVWFSIYGQTGNNDLMAVFGLYLKHKAKEAVVAYAPAPVTAYLGYNSSAPKP